MIGSSIKEKNCVCPDHFLNLSNKTKFDRIKKNMNKDKDQQNLFLFFEKELEKKKEEPKKKSSILHDFQLFHTNKYTDELILFTKNFASLSKSGMPVIKALNTLQFQVKNKHLKKILEDTAFDVGSGIPMHECFRKHKDVFSKLYCDTVKLGEESGRLDAVFERLTNILEKRKEIQENYFKAISYPINIFILAFTEFMILMAYVIPPFSKLYDGFPMPKITKAVIAAGFYLQDNIKIILGTILSVFIFYFIFNKFKIGKLIIDYFKLKIPAFGNLSKKYNLVIYFRNLVMLYNSGVGFISAMRICNETLENCFIKSKMEKASNNIDKGETITEAYRATKIFRKKTMSEIEIGEESGYIDDALEKLADNYEIELNNTIKRIMIMVEPIYVTIMSVISGIVLTAMCLPLYEILKVVSKKN